MRKKLRVVVDTNVLISASFRKLSPIPNSIYNAIKSQQFILITSPQVVEEIEDVLSREKIIKRTHMTAQVRKQFITELIEIAFVVSGDINIHAADYIASGDRHLLNLKQYQGIKIISPRDLVTKLE